MAKKITVRIFVSFLLCFILLAAVVLWWQDATSAANPADSTPKIFVVAKGESIRDIANKLKAEGFIKDQIGFFLHVKLGKLDNKIQAGDFRLNKSMNVSAIAEELTHGSLDVWVTIPEGFRKEEIALKIAQSLSIPESEFLKYAQEGYLFPDTYLFPKDASAAAVVSLFTTNFDNRVTDELVQGFATQGLTRDEGVVLASIVEREGRTDEDRPIIAGVLLNRLEQQHPLQVDATLQYMLGYDATEKSWWRKNITAADKEGDSPYNTYMHVGLPPAPIANPGLSALEAVANPTKTDYFYYIHDLNGVAHFAKTLEEHNQNVAKYLRG